MIEMSRLAHHPKGCRGVGGICKAGVTGCVGWAWSSAGNGTSTPQVPLITTDLLEAGQTVTSQYSHFTFSLLTLTKHQGLWSPSGFLKHKIEVTDHPSLEMYASWKHPD